MCNIDADPADIWVQTRQRARKRYVCSECGAPIPAGFEYWKASGLNEGAWFRYKTHVECQALWDFCWSELCRKEGAMTVGGLADEIDEYDSPELDNAGKEIPGQFTLRDLFESIRDGYREWAGEGKR